MLLSEIAAAVDQIAPFRLAYEWDNVGLQIGDPCSEVDSVLIALEVNDTVIDRSIELDCRAMLVHHPLIFQPRKSIRPDDLTGRFVTRLIREQLGLIVAHTNLDQVLRGTNGALAAAIGLQQLKVLEQTALSELFKLTVFVPRDYTPSLIEAIHRGGGGWIGNYSHCTFRAPGTGTYVPEQGAQPFQGQEGKLEQAEEDRLETLVPKSALRSVLHEVMAAHPYEEVAYDVYPLYDADPRYGLGALGVLEQAATLRELAERLRKACSAPGVSIIGDPSRPVSKVAVISGSAGSSVRSINRSIADVLVTGELSYHYATELRESGVCGIILGHAASEKIFAAHMKSELLNELAVSGAQLRIEAFEDFPEPMLPLEGSVRQE